MNINNITSFHPILKMKWHSKHKIQDKINKYIPVEWQFIIMNNGSLTQNLNSLLLDTTTIEMSQKYNLIFNNHAVTNMRIVWLENYINQNLTFAKSIWVMNTKDNKYKQVLNNKPIGYSLINFEIDIYKDLEEIYCGYCYNLEKIFHTSTLMWGRKYKINYSKNSYITIEEYFTPQLAEFFNVIS
uniref:Hypothetical chloroplast RF21 n=1 Tax=Campylaephora sungminbooi TaxID=1896769 RepID=A0A1B0TIG2_9FLOR|nr:hypothetical chloroplast RF21 [Campylaephora sungminbooi]AKU47507.1 hypothetical chloroplast RF21 [Campylaephora sungminbooi]ALN11954.1 hypothetical chloroplast RF21 [Campylaephora sungminbooi]